MVLAVIGFISFLYPDKVKFKYHFERGQQWHYEDLEAPFDYPIRKPDEELQREYAALEEAFRPYYKLDPNVADEQKARFEERFNRQLEDVKPAGQFREILNDPKPYLTFGRSLLSGLYSHGIIKLNSEHAQEGENFAINLVRGNKTRRTTVGELYTLGEAQTKISDTLAQSALQETEFLLPLIEECITPNIQFNDALTEKFRQDMRSEIVSSRGMVRKGDLIIPRDGIVTDEAYRKLASLKAQYEEQISENRSLTGVYVGYFLLTTLIIGVFVIYLRLSAPEVFSSFVKVMFIFIWIVLYSYLVYLLEITDALSAYILPLCIVPIVIKTFFNSRLALFTHLIVVLIASFLSSLGFEFTFIQILAGIVVLLSDVDTREWTKFFYSMLNIFLTYSIAYLGLSLIQEGSLESVDGMVYFWIFMNVFLTMLSYPLIPLLERMFGFTSSITLVELSDMNRPLLRQLAVKAPGTLQHSLQVANMSESAAQEIGANPLLVKVAALYHDIGKTVQPDFFIENQGGKNPHDDKTYLESAQIIIGHVSEGVRLARKHRLPKMIIDFIRTHHGTTRVEYFYRKYTESQPEGKIDEANFRYPGPRPSSKEETILMMADSIEAACKSIKSPTENDLSELVDKIVSNKITQGQLEDSEMTFQELEQCKRIFKQIMRSVHHGRIQYPEEKESERVGLR